MASHRLVPIVLLSVLGVLTIGFAAWAFILSPSGANLTVQNGTGQTFTAHQFSLNLIETISSGKRATTQGRLIKYTAPDQMVVFQTIPKSKLSAKVPKDSISSSLAQYTAATGGSTAWIAHGSHFERTETLAAYTKRLEPQGSSPGAALPGNVHEVAVVRNGYLVYAYFSVHVKSQTTASGQTEVGGSEQETLHLLQINGAKAPAVTS